jgi:hypothetical protein
MRHLTDAAVAGEAFYWRARVRLCFCHNEAPRRCLKRILGAGSGQLVPASDKLYSADIFYRMIAHPTAVCIVRNSVSGCFARLQRHFWSTRYARELRLQDFNEGFGMRKG